MRRTSTRSKLLPALAVVAVVLAGCGQSTSGDAQGDQQEPTTTTEPTTSAQTTTSKSSKPKARTKVKPAQPQPELCKSSDLKLGLGRGDAGAGTVWRPLRFTNTGDTKCVIQGFPGVSYVAGSDGHQVGAAAYRDGTKGAAVTLAPGATAYAPVGFTQVGNYDPADCKPTKVRGLRVYPPQETHSMYLANAGEGCANENLADYHLKVQTIRPGKG